MEASPGARAELAHVYNTVELTAALPCQAAVATVGLLPKPGAVATVQQGERPICIFSSFFQLWGLLRGNLNTTWEVERADGVLKLDPCRSGGGASDRVPSASGCAGALIGAGGSTKGPPGKRVCRSAQPR